MTLKSIALISGAFLLHEQDEPQDWGGSTESHFFDDTRPDYQVLCEKTRKTHFASLSSVTGAPALGLYSECSQFHFLDTVDLPLTFLEFNWIDNSDAFDATVFQELLDSADWSDMQNVAPFTPKVVFDAVLNLTDDHDWKMARYEKGLVPIEHAKTIRSIKSGTATSDACEGLSTYIYELSGERLH